MTTENEMVYVALKEPNSASAFAIMVDDPRWRKDTAKSVSGWIKEGHSVKHVSMAEGRVMIDNYLREKRLQRLTPGADTKPCQS